MSIHGITIGNPYLPSGSFVLFFLVEKGMDGVINLHMMIRGSISEMELPFR